MSNHPDADEERELIRRAQSAETDAERLAARNELVLRNQGLIFLATRRSMRFGMSIEECYSVAVEAFIYSIDQFDFSYGKLSTYAMLCIKHKVERWAFENQGVIRVSVNIRTRAKSKAITAETKAAAKAARRMLSTDLRTDINGEEGKTIGEQIVFDVQHETYDGPSMRVMLNAMQRIDPRQAEIILLRAGGLTLEEVGDIYRITRERVRQLEKKGRERLQYLLRKYAPPGAR